MSTTDSKESTVSHTDKDRPYWVKNNDPTLPRHEHHSHYWLGRSFTRRRHAKDADGNYRYTLKVEHVPVLKENMDWYLSWEGRLATENLEPIRRPRDRMRFYRYEHRYTCEPVFEEYRVSYADHCTIDEPDTPTHARRDQPCGMVLDYWYYSPYTERVGKHRRQEFNDTRRRTERDALREYVKEVNSTPDWDDLDDSGLPQDRHRHSIIWW